MSSKETIQDFANKDYAYGFVTDFDADAAPRGLSEDTVRLISKNDASLVVGLIAGTVVIFQRPLRFVWETALDVQERYHVDLPPALTIFASPCWRIICWTTPCVP